MDIVTYSPQNIFNSEPHDDKGLDIKEDFCGLVFVVLYRGQNAQGEADEDGAEPGNKREIVREDDQKECHGNYGLKRNDYRTKEMRLYSD